MKQREKSVFRRGFVHQRQKTRTKRIVESVAMCALTKRLTQSSRSSARACVHDRAGDLALGVAEICGWLMVLVGMVSADGSPLCRISAVPTDRLHTCDQLWLRGNPALLR
ncbi:hypothetical protein [Xanthomonas hortorum]|uniref:hypothetical protein n=1 Tax=Xanthomonas hortorum TaxID=56454 RepID=UPI002FE14AEC